MSTIIKDPLVVKLHGRLSYPVLWEKKSFRNGEGRPAFSATCIMDKVKDVASIKALTTAIALLVKEEFGGKALPADRVCLKDGALKEDTDGYGPGIMFIAARNEKTRPGVVDRDLTPLAEEDNKPYAGDYVYMTVRLWAQGGKSFKSEFGKRINATLRNVQFDRRGEPFGEKPAVPEDDFAALPDEADAVL